MVVDRMEFAGRADPLTVKVLTHQRAAVVTNYDSVWIQHRDDLEDEGIT